MSLAVCRDIFDIVIIGGGITAAGIARDASLRGFSCLLLEKGDFASGASSKTSRLIHGGFKHLEAGDFRFVFECLKERDILLRLAPHLIYPIPILIPIFKGQKRKPWQVRADLLAYDLFGFGKSTPRHVMLEKRDALSRAPFLARDDLQKVGQIYDYQIFMPERLVLENIFSARDHGAVCLNYHEATGVRESGDGFELEVRSVSDDSTKSVKARVVVNAAGPWADIVLGGFAKDLDHKASLIKRTHIVVDMDLDQAVYGVFPDGNDPIICLPMLGLTLVGAAETPYSGDPGDAAPTQEEVDRLLSVLRKLLPTKNIQPEAVLWTYSCLKPFAVQKDASGMNSVSDRHIVYRDGKDGKFITVVGGKYTTFRKAAEEAVDAVCKILGRKTPCSTDKEPLFGGGIKDKLVFRENICECTEAIPHLPRETVNHLVNMYGRKCCDLIDLAMENKELLAPLAPGYRDCAAQVLYAVRNESAFHLDDVMLRRLSMGLAPDRGLSGAETVALIMGKELGWSQAELNQEIEKFTQIVRRDMVFSGKAQSS